MKVQIITDSTSDMPEGLKEKLGIRMVPIYLRFGEKTYRDGIDITKDEFYRMLVSSSLNPATSQPNPEDFTSVYKEYCNNADGIVSIHISSKLSGTYNSANIARKTLQSRCPIEIIDSGFNSAGLGLVVTAAARAANDGASLPEVVQEAKKAASEVRMFGIFETMKYLARSGRVNKTIAAASDILHVMPLLTFHQGEVVRAGLVRAMHKGMDRIYDFAKDNAPIKEITVVHSQIYDQAKQLKQRLSKFVNEEKIGIAELGASLGAHGGPGVLLVAIRRAETF
ncbi:MAG TPA: DegV family protein [Dehalococcoidales bacterium]|nr:DegV family protein [Dehalococcoidales bacterium]